MTLSKRYSNLFVNIIIGILILLVTINASHLTTMSTAFPNSSLQLNLSPTDINSILRGYTNDFAEEYIITLRSQDEIAGIKEKLEEFEVEVIKRLEIIPALIVRVPTQFQDSFRSYFGKKIFKSECQQYYSPKLVESHFSLTDSEVPILSESVNADGVSFTGKGIKIAILDSGICEHGDLNIAKSYINKEIDIFGDDETANDELGHGTHIAGIATGSGENSEGNKYQGIAPDAILGNFKCINDLGSGSAASVIDAIDEAVKWDADVISMSIGMSGSSINNPVCLAVDAAVEKGIVVVVSAGNEGPGHYTIGSPALALRAISVGATTLADEPKVAQFSSRGPSVDNRADPDICAPGVEVISALAKDSMFDIALQGIDPSPIIKGENGNDYIPADGTSMSTPVVAGAIALLLEGYPEASPQTIKAALLESADDLGEDELIQGKGYLNVGAALDLLQAENENYFSVQPTNNALLFYSNFLPGEERTFFVEVTSGAKDTFQINLDPAMNGSKYINVNSSQVINDIGPFVLEVSLRIPLNASPGTYSSEIEITNTATGTVRSVKLGPFSIYEPKGRIYWDYFHDFGGGDNGASNYREAQEILASKGYQIIEHDTTIQSQILMNYDILLIPDPEAPFTSSEIDAMFQFLQQGGGILFLSSYYPFCVINSFNNLSSNFGLTIQPNYPTMIDSGFQEYPKKKSIPMTLSTVNDLSLDKITSLWYSGTEIEISQNAREWAHIEENSENKTVGGVFMGNVTYPGRLLVFGQELSFYNDYINDDNNDELLVTLIEWLYCNNLPTNRFTPLITNDWVEAKNNTMDVGTYIWSQLDEPVRDKIVNLTIYYPNASLWKTIILDEELSGYYGTNLSLPNIWGYYCLEFQSTSIPSKEITLLLYNETDDPCIQANVVNVIDSTNTPKSLWEADYAIPGVIRGQYRVIFSLNLTGDVSLKEPTLHLFSYLEGTYETEGVLNHGEIYYKSMNLTKEIVGEEIIYRSEEWEIDKDLPSGYYFYYVDLYTVHELPIFNYTGIYGMVYIYNYEPKIDASKSSIAGTSLKDHQSENSNGELIYLSAGNDIPIEIVGSDNETSKNELKAYLIFLDISIYNFYGIIFEIVELDLADDGKKWITTFKLPSIDRIPFGNEGNDVIISQRVLYFLMVLKDPEGSLTIEVVAFALDFNPFFFEMLDILGIIVLLVGGLLIFIYLFRSPRKGTQQKIQDDLKKANMGYIAMKKGVSPNQRFCPFCGIPLESQEHMFCTQCGHEIEFPSNQPDI